MIDSKISLGIGLLCMVMVQFISFTQFILYLDTFDGLFKKVLGNNISGIVEPKILLTSKYNSYHHDSSPVYPFMKKLPCCSL